MAGRRLASLAVLSVAGAACGVAAGSEGSVSVSSSAEATAAKRVRYFDSRREDPQAPDIGTVVVSNTDAARPSASTITFRIEIPNRPALTDEMSIAVGVDADDDPRTGVPDNAEFPGADYLIMWDRALDEDARVEPSPHRPFASRTRGVRSSVCRRPTWAIPADSASPCGRSRGPPAIPLLRKASPGGTASSFGSPRLRAAAGH
jgi:hypothetical protein